MPDENRPQIEVLVYKDGKTVRLANWRPASLDFIAFVHFDSEKNIMSMTGRPSTWQTVRLLFREKDAYFTLAMMQDDAPLPEGSEIIWEIDMDSAEDQVKFFRNFGGKRYDIEKVRAAIAERLEREANA